MANRDPLKRKQYNAEYRALHRDELNARERERFKDPEYKAKHSAYRRSKLAVYAQYQLNYRRNFPKQYLLTDAKSRAKKAGIPFDVSYDDIDWVTHCPVLGVELAYVKGDGKVRSNSATLDRRDNSRGYVKGNVCVLSHRANRLKSDASIAELEAILLYAKGGHP